MEHTLTQITHEELQRRLHDPWLSVVNVSPLESFLETRIPGSISLPIEDIQATARHILRDVNRDIAVYCSGTTSQLSEQASLLLQEMGYANVRHFSHGISGWIAAGGPIEQGKRAHAVTRGRNRHRERSFESGFHFLASRSFLDLLVVWFSMVLFFGLLYYLFALLGTPDLQELGQPVLSAWRGLATSLYFSFVTATSVGFGDVVPLGAVRALAVAESAMGLLLFGLVISKLVSQRQEQLIEEIHHLAFEDRLARVRTNLHFVLVELQHIESECTARAFSIERIMPRIESAMMVFLGELKSMHELLYQTRQIPDESALQALLASLAANLRQIRSLLDLNSEDDGLTDSFSALAFNAVLKSHLESISEMSLEICGDCIPRQYLPGLKTWLDQIQNLAHF